jgi:SAM-dependent methyltransferase
VRPCGSLRLVSSSTDETPPGGAAAGSPRSILRRIVASYDSVPVRIYSRIRFSILRQVFLEEIGQYLPREGRVLDIGCGFGLFSLYFASLAPGCQLTGVDRDARRSEGSWSSRTSRIAPAGRWRLPCCSTG